MDDLNFIKILEWLSFGFGALTVWRYGYSKKQGAILGITTALMFLLWGAIGGFWAAFLTNIGFFVLHANNLKIALKEIK